MKCLRENKYVYYINRIIFTVYGFGEFDTIFIYNLHLNVCECRLTFYFNGARRKNIILSIFFETVELMPTLNSYDSLTNISFKKMTNKFLLFALLRCVKIWDDNKI